MVCAERCELEILASSSSVTQKIRLPSRVVHADSATHFGVAFFQTKRAVLNGGRLDRPPSPDIRAKVGLPTVARSRVQASEGWWT